MHGIYELKEMLCDELEKYGEKSDLSTGSLDVVDKLAHTIKNLDKIINEYEESEDGYSSRYYDGGMNYDGNISYRRGGGRSYARGRRRDSMGRYSRTGLADKLRELMHDAPDEKTRMEIEHLANKMDKG